MTEMEVERIEARVPGVIVMDSKARGLKYFFDDNQSRMAIGGQKGLVILSMRQARMLARELAEVIEQRQYFTERKPYQKITGGNNEKSD
jgi:hypothetical protein